MTVQFKAMNGPTHTVAEAGQTWARGQSLRRGYLQRKGPEE